MSPCLATFRACVSALRVEAPRESRIVRFELCVSGHVSADVSVFAHVSGLRFGSACRHTTFHVSRAVLAKVETLQAKLKVVKGLITRESEPVKGTMSAAAADCVKAVVARMFVQWSDAMQHPESKFANVKNDIGLSISISESIADYDAIHALSLPPPAESVESQEQQDSQLPGLDQEQNPSVVLVPS